MIKTLLVGIWSGGVALGGAYLATMLNTASPEQKAGDEGPKTVEFIKSDSMSIPIIREGKVIGYVVTEMSFAVAKSAEGKDEPAPTPFLVDAAFRSIYENISADFGHLKPQDLKALSEQIKKASNERLGKDMVQDVLVSSINFVARDEIRTNWVKQKH